MIHLRVARRDGGRGRSAELLGSHQGRRHRRRRCQRRQPDDRSRAQGRGVHRHQHRRPGTADERCRRQARHRSRPDPRPGGRGEPGGGPQGGRGPRRGDRRGHQGRRHGLRDGWRGRRHRHGRSAGRGADRPGPGCADHRRCDPAVQLRGSAPLGAGRGGHRVAPLRGRHPHRDPQRPPAVADRSQDQHDRRLPPGRPRAAAGRLRHHRPHHHPWSDQPRLRRCEVGHGGGRLGADGHRLGPGRGTRGHGCRGRDQLTAAGGHDRRRPRCADVDRRRLATSGSSRSTRPRGW